MADPPVVTLTVALKQPDLEAEETNRLTRRLLQEMRSLDEVAEATLAADTEMPEGAKALGGVLLGVLKAQFSIENAKPVMAFLHDRLMNKAVEMEVEANGKKLKIKASSQQELIAAVQAAEQFLASA